MDANHPPPKSSPAIVAMAVPKRGRRWLHLPQSRWRKFVFLAVYGLFCWGLVLAGSKLFWRFRAGVPFDQTAEIWDFYYPELRQSRVKELHPRHDDVQFDVLLLGGSVLEPAWGSVEACLAEKLRAETGEHFRIFNLGHSAHTSRDSLLKYGQLPDEQFELVIVYDGINDVRLNCCPRAQFRDDYRHYAWYNSLQKRLAAGTTLLPASLLDEAALVNETFAFDPKNEALIEEGRDIKTAETLRRNLEEIARTAATRHDKVLLTTFAYFIPANYTPERFKIRSLDYSFRKDGRSCDVEMWGKPMNVARALEAQNAAVRDLAALHSEVSFVDERELTPEEGGLFVDPCHLTDEGSRLFVENLWPAVKRRIDEWQAARGSATSAK